MERHEIVRRAIEFNTPPRLPFFLGEIWGERLRDTIDGFPNDVCDCYEMDRQKAGWFFDNPQLDDWGCGWQTSNIENMGQVVSHPLENWNALETYLPPNPKNPFYFDRIEENIKGAQDRYVVVTCHFNLFERLHMLHGFENTLMDFYLEPSKIEKILDMILAFKIDILDELARRFKNRIHGIFFTDDWGTQQGTLVSKEIFHKFFFNRYKALIDAVHGHKWHFILHSCGKINDFVPLFIDLGVDVLNMQQPQAYGIREIGQNFAGKICFLTTVDIQSTLPGNDETAIQEEAKELVKYWSTPQGGFIVFNYGDPNAIGTTDKATETMFRSFFDLATYWAEDSQK